MRTEQEMFDLILSIAEKDDNIRVVAMNGSRTNRNIPKDQYQDFDIVYIVYDVKRLIESRQWINQFGDRLIMQTPMDADPKGQRWFTFLMQFMDGNRIDLMIVPIEDMEMYLKSDKLLEILMDKDSLISGVLPATDEDYHIRRPSLSEYHNTINEFLWISLYVIKGIKRNELIYAMDHLGIVRDMLLQMMTWQVGIKTDFKISIGKNYKYLRPFVKPELWQKLMVTYELGTETKIWDALDVMLAMFEIACDRVGDSLNYSYNRHEFHQVKQTIYEMREEEK